MERQYEVCRKKKDHGDISGITGCSSSEGCDEGDTECTCVCFTKDGAANGNVNYRHYQASDCCKAIMGLNQNYEALSAGYWSEYCRFRTSTLNSGCGGNSDGTIENTNFPCDLLTDQPYTLSDTAETPPHPAFKQSSSTIGGQTDTSGITQDYGPCNCKDYSYSWKCVDVFNPRAYPNVRASSTGKYPTNKENIIVRECGYQWSGIYNEPFLPQVGLWIPSSSSRQFTSLYRHLLEKNTESSINNGIFVDGVAGLAVPQAQHLQDELLLHNPPRKRGTNGYASQYVVKFPGQCLRWPFARVHPDNFNDSATETLFHDSNGEVKTLYNEESLIGYCEDFSSTAVPGDNNENNESSSFVHCGRDRNGFEERNRFCSTKDAQVVVISIAINGRSVDSTCKIHNETQMSCLVVPGDDLSGISQYVRSNFIFGNVTFLLVPFNQSLLVKLAPKVYTIPIAQSDRYYEAKSMQEKTVTVDTDSSLLYNQSIFDLFADYATYASDDIEVTRRAMTEFIEKLESQFERCTPKTDYTTPNHVPKGVMIYSDCIQINLPWTSSYFDFDFGEGVSVHVASAQTRDQLFVMPGTYKSVACKSFVATSTSLTIQESTIFDLSMCPAHIEATTQGVPIEIRHSGVIVSEEEPGDDDVDYSTLVNEYNKYNFPLSYRFKQNVSIVNATIYSEHALVSVVGLPNKQVQLGLVDISAYFKPVIGTAQKYTSYLGLLDNTRQAITLSAYTSNQSQVSIGALGSVSNGDDINRVVLLQVTRKQPNASITLTNLQKLNLTAETSLFSQSQLISIFGKPGSPLALFMVLDIIAYVIITTCALIGIASYIYDKQILEKANDYLAQHPSNKKHI